MVGVVDRPWALPEIERIELVLASGVTEESELEVAGAAPGLV